MYKLYVQDNVCNAITIRAAPPNRGHRGRGHKRTGKGTTSASHETAAKAASPGEDREQPMTTHAVEGPIVSVANLRKELGEIIGRVSYKNERTMISKNGKNVAALVPLEDLERLERLELEEDNRALLAAMAEDDGTRIPFSQYLKENSK